MTDNEIIKALDCCAIDDGANCEQCPMNDLHRNDCYSIILHKHSLDLINRQKAEIERLKDDLHACTKEVIRSHEIDRNKAIKEFAEKLKEHSRKMQSSDFSGEFWDKAVLVETIDNLVKEMVGDK